MNDQFVRFLESVSVQQTLDPFSSGQLARLVLSFDAGFTAPLLGLTIATMELLSSFVCIHEYGILELNLLGQQAG